MRFLWSTDPQAGSGRAQCPHRLGSAHAAGSQARAAPHVRVHTLGHVQTRSRSPTSSSADANTCTPVCTHVSHTQAGTHTHLPPHTARSLAYVPVGLLGILGESGSSAEPPAPSPPRAQAGWVSRPPACPLRLRTGSDIRRPHGGRELGPTAGEAQLTMPPHRGAWARTRRASAAHPAPGRRCRRRALTDEGHGLAVDDAAGQQVEVVLLAVHHHCVPGVVAPLGTESRLSVRGPQGSEHPGRACPATLQAVLTAGARETLLGCSAWQLCPQGVGHTAHLRLGASGLVVSRCESGVCLVTALLLDEVQGLGEARTVSWACADAPRCLGSGP